METESGLKMISKEITIRRLEKYLLGRHCNICKADSLGSLFHVLMIMVSYPFYTIIG